MTERTISEALTFILETEGITTKHDLDVWCGNQRREKLYTRIYQLAPTHWERIKEPKAYVRYYYEHKLIGYKVYSPTSEKFTCPSPAGCTACSIYKMGKMPMEEAHQMMNDIRASKINKSEIKI